MKKIVVFAAILLFLLNMNIHANDLVPVPVIDVTPSQTWFYNLDDVIFDADDSYVPNGYIYYTKWYVDGNYQTGGSYYRDMDICFALYGSPANGCYQLAQGQTTVTVMLEVQSNTGYWDSVSQIYTIQEHKGRKYFVKDHIGNVRATVNLDGNVLGYSDYYPFGLEMRSNNTANPNDNYKFTGHERDDEAGLTLDYMMARNYDPVIGRFMQIDNFHDKYPDQSPYNYALNNPLFYTDITGDTVEIAYSELEVPGFYHVSVIYRDNETGEETNIVEGFPAKRPAEHLAENLATGDWGNLVGSIETDPTDVGAGDREMIPVPEGMTEEEFVSALEGAFASYDNNVTYKPLFPNAGQGNSNSLVGSVLRKSGSDFTPSRNTPGFKRNVLPSQDRRSIATKITDNVKGFLGRMQSAIRTASF